MNMTQNFAMLYNDMYYEKLFSENTRHSPNG